ncbi:sugar ABC transporter permease [Streptosporangium violaceochromogenes]|nr:sugar ABC transporter permease [Streptosporangium violaceochromogenes]
MAEAPARRGGPGRAGDDGPPRLLRRVAGALDRKLTVLFLLPGMLCLALVILYPLGYNVWTSFTDKNLQFPGDKLIGFGNYVSILADSRFWNAALRSVSWTVASVLGQFAIGLLAALALERVTRGRTVLRVILIVPWTFSPIVMAFVWRYMLDGLGGVLNAVLLELHLIDKSVAFFGEAGTALPSATLVNIWFGYPFMMLALVAGIQAIPRELYEAAVVDGASYWRTVFSITLPALRPIVGTLIVLRTIWVFNNFDIIYLTTGGGPRDASTTLPVYAFNVGWNNFDVGRMAAVAVVMTIVLLAVTAVYMRLLRFEEERT